MIKFNEIESIFVISAKGALVGDEHLYPGLVKDYNNLESIVDSLDSDSMLNLKNLEIQTLVHKELASVKEYNHLVKAYFAIYGSSLSYETYSCLVEVLGDIVFKIDPNKFKEATYKVHGNRPSLHRNILSEFSNVISRLNRDEYSVEGKYLPSSYIEKFPNRN